MSETPKPKRELLGVHPQWYLPVLMKLEEKYPEIADEVWSECVFDNVRSQGRLVIEDEMQELRDTGNSGSH
jgi:2-iminoacetate synthase ThiH